MNRGSADLGPVFEDSIDASMRPRFMNRGSPGGRGRRPAFRLASFNEAPIHESGKCAAADKGNAATHRASMRPRFMNRGSNEPSATWATAGGRFNEAPIHESGK